MKKLEFKSSCGNTIVENPVMILNSIARLFDARARGSGVFPDSLPHSSQRLMRILAKSEGISMIHLVEYTHLSKPTVSLGLKKMEEMGLVTKESDPSDARISKIYLTEKGKNLERLNFENLQRIDRSVMRGLTEEEIETVTKILIKMRNNLLCEDETE